jgi:hypothetical protein
MCCETTVLIDLMYNIHSLHACSVFSVIKIGSTASTDAISIHRLRLSPRSWGSCRKMNRDRLRAEVT